MKGPPLIYNFKWVGILNVNLTVRKRDSKETATAATAIHQQASAFSPATECEASKAFAVLKDQSHSARYALEALLGT